MAQYRKKPVTVEAVQWLGHKETPMECVRPYYLATPRYERGLIDTLDGLLTIWSGNWIITGPIGKSLCNSKEFERDYEPADTPSSDERLREACEAIVPSTDYFHNDCVTVLRGRLTTVRNLALRAIAQAKETP